MNRLVDYAERLLLILLAAPFLLAFARNLPTHPYYIALAITEGLSVALILVRRPGAMVIAPLPVAVAFLGTALPLLARPGGIALIPGAVGSALMIGGLVLSLAAKLALNRSFGIVAANRGVKRGGPYRLVRHPMYLGYLITQASFLLLNFSLPLLALYLTAWSAQVRRVIEEERVLIHDPLYGRFAAATRWRVVPGLF